MPVTRPEPVPAGIVTADTRMKLAVAKFFEMLTEVLAPVLKEAVAEYHQKRR